MKNVHLYSLLVCVFLASCTDKDNNSDVESIITATKTCSYSDFNIEQDTNVTLDCLLDLEQQTVDVPSGVTFHFDGGDIFNGTLNFASTGTIDDELLNADLEVQGDVQLINDEFQLYYYRWNLIAGETTSDIAQSNNDELERLMQYSKNLDASTFKIDEFDAYFQTSHVTSTTTNQNFYPSLEAINLPSDFNLVMTDNTHLRIYPGEADDPSGVLFAVREVENVTITGGVLYGDRDEKEYPVDGADAAGTSLIAVNASVNVVLDGITFRDASKNALSIYSLGFPFNSDYIPTVNLTVQNCTFENNRRMSVVITDGTDIKILNNTFIDNDQDSINSQSGEVGYAINIEPYRTRDTETGELIEYQKVTNVLIKGNTETNSRVGFLTVTIGQDIIVEDNNIDTRMVWSFVNGVKIRNNIFNAVAGSDASESWAFYASGTGVTVYDNEFSGNTITGYAIGMVVGSVDIDVYENTITDVSAGIQISDATDASIYDNVVESEGDALRFANTTADNVSVTGNTFTTSGFMARVTNSNNSEGTEDFSIFIDDNQFNGDGSVNFYLSNGVTFSNNVINGGVKVASDVTNYIIDNNTIIPQEIHGIELSGEHQNITISNNTISEPVNSATYICINNQSTTPNEIVLSGNTCR